MATPARRRNQCRQTLDQFVRREQQSDAAAGTRLDALIDQVFGVDFTQSFQRKGRPGAVAQQALQTLAVGPPPTRMLASSEKPPSCSRFAIVSASSGSSTPTRHDAPSSDRSWKRISCMPKHPTRKRHFYLDDA